MPSTTDKRTPETVETTSDNDHDELTRWRAEAATARKAAETASKELHALKLDKATTIARNEFNREWREGGFAENDPLRKTIFRTFVQVDPEDYSVRVLNPDGTESIGADIPALMKKLPDIFPGVKPPKSKSEDDETNGSGGSAPATPSGVPGLHTRKSKDDFTMAQKIAFINAHGLSAWERIPVSNKPSNAGGATPRANLARNWNQSQRDAFVQKNGGGEKGFDALKELLRKEREKFPR